MDGHLGYSAEDGKVVWDFDTAREFQTVNGVKAKGGSIDGPGPVVANGMLFINSGYFARKCLARTCSVTTATKGSAQQIDKVGQTS